MIYQKITEEFDVSIPMRDGVKLNSIIVKPVTNQNLPSILLRTPYLTVPGYFEKLINDARFFASNGYVFIIQNCRGKNGSEGIFYPFKNDGEDGYDTIKWIINQKWSNGSVGTIGASYSGWNQWKTAILNPPGLKTMITIVSLPDPVYNVPYQNGALVLWMAEWLAMVEGKINIPTNIYNTEKLLKHLPLKTMDRLFGWDSKIWKDWIEHSILDDYWKETFYEDKLDKIKIPVLHISGWYDDDIIGTHKNYYSITHNKNYNDKEYFQKLIIGPWPHKVNTNNNWEIDFGPHAFVDLRKIELNWFDKYLKNKNINLINNYPVEIFIMGENKWANEKKWPPENVKYINYYLHSEGRANSLFGDGILNDRLPNNEKNDEYDYDPMNPVPHIHNPLNLDAEGPFDQRAIEMRNDVLVYQTETLNYNLRIAGDIFLKLYISSSAKNTDFWAQITDVYPNGYSMHLTENIIRCKFRNGLENEEYFDPNKITACNIDLWVIANTFLKGHRIRLDISSSCFPKYDRNLNTTDKFGSTKKYKIAHQRIFHDKENPSYLRLPVIKKF